MLGKESGPKNPELPIVIDRIKTNIKDSKKIKTCSIYDSTNA
jgi:hypothetical protein